LTARFELAVSVRYSIHEAAPNGVKITKSSTSDDITTTEVRLEEGRWPTVPVAPASLWKQEVEQAAWSLSFIGCNRSLRTRRSSRAMGCGILRCRSGPYSLFSWFTREQLDAVRDTTVRSQRDRFCDLDSLLVAEVNPNLFENLAGIALHEGRHASEATRDQQ